jgi:hypothetical protein
MKKIRDMILSDLDSPDHVWCHPETRNQADVVGPYIRSCLCLDRFGLVKNIPYKGAIVATDPKEKSFI